MKLLLPNHPLVSCFKRETKKRSTMLPQAKQAIERDAYESAAVCAKYLRDTRAS
jgi:hypothetical protein